MKALVSVLVATDFSPEAGLAARRAASIGREAGLRGTLVHVLPGSLPADMHIQAAAQAQQALALVAEELTQDGVPVEPRLLSGDIAGELTRAASQFDLVVAGARGEEQTDKRSGSCTAFPVRCAEYAIKCAEGGGMKASRALITFAFIADQFDATRDIGDGLLPLFVPIADQLAGQVFDPATFAERCSEDYGIKVHPLGHCRSGGEVQGDGADQTSNQCGRRCSRLLEEFTRQAKNALSVAQVTLSTAQLQEELLARLIRPELLDIILKPRRTDLVDANTLSASEITGETRDF